MRPPSYKRPVFDRNVLMQRILVILISQNHLYIFRAGARGGLVVKALRYKPAGRGFDSRRCQWNFSVT